MQLAPSHFYQNVLDLKTAIAMGIIVLAIIMAILRYSAPEVGGKRISRRAFRRRAMAIGLTKNQARLLVSFMKEVQQPASLLANTRELNRVLAEALRDCSDAENPMVKNRQLEIYEIKQHIDKVFVDRGNVTSSKQLRINQKITFQQEDGKRFSSWITANLKEFYCVRVPKELEEKSTKWRRGSKIRHFILSIDGEEVVFESKVLGYTNIMREPSIILGHTAKENRSLLRKHRRRAISGHVAIYLVRIVEKRRKQVLSSNNLAGTLIDLSPGGCSISSRNPLDLGELVKLVFEYKTGESVVVFGEIVNTRSIDRTRSIAHVMFTKASVEDMNLINSYVYNLG